MPNKLQYYQTVAEQAAYDVIASYSSWTTFLDASAKMYKYPFPDQLLIHAQRPDAIACAPIETWNDIFNRWVRRGTKGIALIDDTGSYPRLKYVFDVADTEEAELSSSRSVFLWEMRQEHSTLVLEALDKIYDDVEDSIVESFRNIAKQLAYEYYSDNAREIRFRAEDSFSEEFDELSLGDIFEEMLTNSIAYTLMSRCGLDTAEHFNDEDFRHLNEFNTADIVYALGTATNELSAQVLRDIETIIKKYERQQTAERGISNERNDNIHTGRGLSSAGYQTGRATEGADRTSGQLREDAESVLERASEDNLQQDVVERDAVPAPTRNRERSELETGTSDELVDSQEPASRQIDQSDGLDSGDEHIERPSQRNGTERANLRGLAEEDSVSAPLLEFLSTSSITLDEVDSILRDGGNDKNSILRIAAHFAKNLPNEDNAAYLPFEYLEGRFGSREKTPGGKGYKFGAQETSVWFDENGITIGRGKSALLASDYVTLTWEQAAERVKTLYDMGMYVSHDVLDEALYNESKERGNDVEEVYANISRRLSDIRDSIRRHMTKEQREATKDDWKDRRYLIRGLFELHDKVYTTLNSDPKPTPEEVMALYNETLTSSEPIPGEWNFSASYQETEDTIAELLRDKGIVAESDIRNGRAYSELSEYAIILNRLREDIDALNNEPNTPIRFWRNPYRALNNLEKAGLPTHGFPVANYKAADFTRFITDDEINRYLNRGGSYSEGKMRMLSHFLHEHTPKERVSFIKSLYGYSGGTWIGGGSYEAIPGKGITLKRPDCDEVKLNWNQVVQRIQGLITNGQFATRADLDSIPSYERLMLVRDIKNFFFNMPLDHELPFDKELDFYHPKEAEWEAICSLLDNPEKVEALHSQMQYIYANTPEGDRYYECRKAGFEKLSAYRDGTYTLFPGVENLPAPEVVVRRSSFSAQSHHTPIENEVSSPSTQLSLFGIEAIPGLPSASEQRDKIEQKSEQIETQELSQEKLAPEEDVYVDSDYVTIAALITQDEIDALLLTIKDEEKTRIAEQFTINPRSREAVALVREIYSNIEQTTLYRGFDDEVLFMHGRNTGVDIIRDVFFESVHTYLSTNPELASDNTISLSWAEIIKRITELMQVGRFAVVTQENTVFEEPSPITELTGTEQASDISPLYAEYLQLKAENPDDIVIFQVGDFYEFYNQDAEIVAKVLDIALESREIKGIAEPVKMMHLTIDMMARHFFTLYDAGFSITMSSINQNGSRAVLNTPQENRVRDKTVLDDIDQALDETDVIAVEDIDEQITPTQDTSSFDFGVVAQTILERIMQDTEFVSALNESQVRGSIRKPLNTALEISVYENQEHEPSIYHAYHNDDDFNDRLFEYLYLNAWELRQSREVEDTTLEESSIVTESSHIYEHLAANDVDAYGSNNRYSVGDNVYHMDRLYIIDSIDDSSVYLVDPQLAIPIKMHLFRHEFDGFLARDERNSHLLQVVESTPSHHEDALASTSNVQETSTQDIDYSSNITNIPAGKPPTVANNFRITDESLGVGGAKTKFRYNMDAIHVLRDLEIVKRAATPEEQQILSRYVGWGGLQQAFDPNNKQWTNEYLELNASLSSEEWESARSSTLNAHYTSPTIIKAIYEAVERMGFKSGNILEPACGIGNFFGLLPESMQQSKLYGVELDSVTAKIAKHLYPNAHIQETGFEKTDMPDAFFDLAIGNVPFGSYGVVDKCYDKHKFMIHDYFFAKSLDQVRPGGIVAFITSKSTLDKTNPDMRKYLAQRADLLGAVRLPNNAFLKNAGTEVTADIIFLQKRDRPIDIEPDWVHLGHTEDEISINRYFADNPEMVLGKMAVVDGHRMYGNENSATCLPIEGADLGEQLRAALLNIRGQITEVELDDLDGVDNHAIPADPRVKNFSYAIVTPAADGGITADSVTEGRVYFRENSLMYPVELPATTLERIKGMVAIRDCTQELIALQVDEHEEDEIKSKQVELNNLYDAFTAEYGLINSTANSRAFNADSAYYLLSSLEMLDEDNNLERKADMFTKRTIKTRVAITKTDTSSEALAVSLSEKAYVDLEYMETLTGFSRDKIIADLRGVIFLNIGYASDQTKTYVTADEYLSGNVREKLERARAAQAAVGDSSLDVNVEALEAVQPKHLEAHEISVRLGSTWIDKEYIQQFMNELLPASKIRRKDYQVNYSPRTGEWQVSGRGRTIYSDIHATVTYGTGRMNAYEIIHDTLNLRDVRVYDYKKGTDGKDKRELNKKETTLAQQKQELIKQQFNDWIWQDPERRQSLVALYNEKFNSTRSREFDGSHLTFPGMSPQEKLNPHQANGAARVIYGGNTLLAHVVGAGKTFTMIAAAMELKRIGLCNKSLIAVPNHLTEQWASQFLRLYPAANILVAKKKDFEMRNRKKFCAKIATGDYDAVIIGHSQLEKIPLSTERQQRILNEQIQELDEAMQALSDERDERFTVKQIERTKKSLEIHLSKLLDGKKKDDVVTFEQLGVERLFIDESHYYKNL